MWALAASFVKIVWRRPATLFACVVTSACLGFFARLSYHNFLYLQAQNINQLSAFNEIVMPLAGLTLFCQLVMTIISAVQLLPSLHGLQQSSLIEQSSIRSGKLLGGLLSPILLAGLWPWINFLFIVGLLATLSSLDLARLTLTAGGLLVINAIASLLIFTLCGTRRRVLSALLLSVVVMSLLLVIESSLWFWWVDFNWQGLFNPFFRLREGELLYADLVSLVGWMLVGLSGCYLLLIQRLNVSRALPLMILLCGIGLAIFASYCPGQFDLTDNRRNSLADEINLLLKDHQETLEVIAVIDEETARDEIRRGFEILQRSYPNSRMVFRARQTLAPELQQQGEYLLLQMDKFQQVVSYPFNQPVKAVIETAVKQMLNRKTQWITFIEGHGEASPLGKATSDLGELYHNLTAMGWPVAVQNLQHTPIISDNTQLLVIASSKQAWMKSEIDLVLEYLQKGGNLLLLCDPDAVVPAALEEFIGIRRYSGTLVDWSGYQSGTPHPAIVIVNRFTAHPVVSHLNSLLAFPWASGLQTIQPENHRLAIEPVILSNSGVWNEQNIDQAQLVFDPQQGEEQHAFALAMAAVNSANQQKILVVGDSRFASDSAINNYANKQFALNLVSWLTNIALPDQELLKADDSNIEPSRFGRWMFEWGFSLLFPALVIAGWLLSLWRRRQSIG